MTAKRPPEARKEPKFRENAINYVDAQLATMAKYGSAPVLSPEEYYSLVDECEQVGRKIWKASEKRTTGEPSIKIASGRDAAEWEQNQAEQRMQEKSQSAARKTPSLRNEPLTNILDEQSIADWMRDEAIEKEALRELFAAIQGLDLESNYVVDGKCHADRARIAVKRPR